MLTLYPAKEFELRYNGTFVRARKEGTDRWFVCQIGSVGASIEYIDAVSYETLSDAEREEVRLINSGSKTVLRPDFVPSDLYGLALAVQYYYKGVSYHEIHFLGMTLELDLRYPQMGYTNTTFGALYYTRLAKKQYKFGLDQARLVVSSPIRDEYETMFLSLTDILWNSSASRYELLADLFEGKMFTVGAAYTEVVSGNLRSAAFSKDYAFASYKAATVPLLMYRNLPVALAIDHDTVKLIDSSFNLLKEELSQFVQVE